MPIKRIIVLLDESVDSLPAVHFAFRHFNDPRKRIIGLVQGNDDDHAYTGHSDSIPDFLNKFNLRLIQSEQLRNQLADMLIELQSMLNSHFTIRAIDENEPDAFLHECQFADLLISSRNTFEKGIWPSFGSGLLLADTAKLRCPRIIVPDSFVTPRSVVLINNSHEDTLLAIKRFCLIFTRHCPNWDVNLLDISDEVMLQDQLRNQKLLVSYVQTHCPRLAVHQFHGETPEQLRRFMGVDQHTLIVTGESVDNEWLQAYFLEAGVATIS